MFVFTFYYHYIVQCFINMDPMQGNGQSGSVGALPSIVASPPVRPESESGVLGTGCLNLRGRNEVEKKDKIGSMFEECK